MRSLMCVSFRCLFGLHRRDARDMEPIVSLRIPGTISVKLLQP